MTPFLNWAGMYTASHLILLPLLAIININLALFLQIKTFSSLPNSYRNRAKLREGDIQRARSKDELPHHMIRDTSPKLPRDLMRVRAPPVPPRMPQQVADDEGYEDEDEDPR